jgi:hypothetical protein
MNAQQNTMLAMPIRNNRVIACKHSKPDAIPDKWQPKPKASYCHIFHVAYWTLMREQYSAQQLNVEQTQDYLQYLAMAREIFVGEKLQKNAPMVSAHKPCKRGNGKFYRVATRQDLERVISRYANWQARLRADRDTRIDLRIFLDGLYYRLENESLSLYRLNRELLAMRDRLATLFIPDEKLKRKRKGKAKTATVRVLSDNGVGKRKLSIQPLVLLQWNDGTWHKKEYKLSVARNAHHDANGWCMPKALLTFLKKQNLANGDYNLQYVGINANDVSLR